MTAFLQVLTRYTPQILAFLFLVWIFWKIRTARIANEEKKRLIVEKNTLREDSLLWLSTSFNSHMNSIKEAIKNLNFPVEQHLNNPHDWKVLKHQVNRLEHLGTKLKEYLEKERV